MGSPPSRPVLSRSECQDELVKMIPGDAAKIIRRPKTNLYGSDIVTNSNFEFPDLHCERYIKELCKAMRIEHKIGMIKSFSGIDVDLEAMLKNISAEDEQQN